jgi:hypothetical protein
MGIGEIIAWIAFAYLTTTAIFLGALALYCRYSEDKLDWKLVIVALEWPLLITILWEKD